MKKSKINIKLLTGINKDLLILIESFFKNVRVD